MFVPMHQGHDHVARESEGVSSSAHRTDFGEVILLLLFIGEIVKPANSLQRLVKALESALVVGIVVIDPH